MGEIGIIVWLAALLVVIAWVLLPFAMFGIKPLLRELISQSQKTNAILASMQTEAQAEESKEAVSASAQKSVEITAPWEK